MGNLVSDQKIARCLTCRANSSIGHSKHDAELSGVHKNVLIKKKKSEEKNEFWGQRKSLIHHINIFIFVPTQCTIITFNIFL